MSEQNVDEFYSARNLLYLGAFPQALSALSQFTHLSGALELEHKSLLYRAYIGQGNYALVLDEIPANTSNSTLQVIRQLALVKQEASVDSQAAIIEKVEELIAVTNDLQNTTFVAIAAQILIICGQQEAALKILALHSKNLECVAMTVVAYLSINRVDLAQKLTAKLRTWAEDAPIAQLAEAWTALSVGGAKYNEAFYIFEELAQASSVSTARLLTALAVCKMHLAQYPEAESLLLEAFEKDSNDPDVLANLVICANLSSKPLETKSRYLSQLKHLSPTHPFIVDLEAKDAEFDAITARLSA
ncbi:hypothetical protein COEREDRAFT_44931 [Coemansia reversa NRRL 1564]|uniref:Coatomer subunit epsilon n=1 Tax=Coemansia reversa (strain ATCC 12441 / NRRL 1564) TaxID=763665 RepID=A0A2G5B8P2_COERN|nr:hypothetical protein COEREDRAFT_44931 [Coemansia reversa NRRL 1564]|eukprot:PIA15379.1 hypothetical protein COEREDRAFT_44931 [Coemansia reversa NRRL 1564]